MMHKKIACEKQENKKLFYDKIVCFSIIIIVALFICYSYYLKIRNERYISKVNNYSIYVSTPRDSHYKEKVGDFTIEIWNLFKFSLKNKPMAVVKISLDNVYWEEKDDYITIGIQIQEDLTGKFRYLVNYESCLPIDKKSLIEEGDTVYQYIKPEYINKGHFEINQDSVILHVYSDEVLTDMEIEEYENFLLQNREAFEKIIERINYYWNLDMTCRF